MSGTSETVAACCCSLNPCVQLNLQCTGNTAGIFRIWGASNYQRTDTYSIGGQDFVILSVVGEIEIDFYCYYTGAAGGMNTGQFNLYGFISGYVNVSYGGGWIRTTFDPQMTDEPPQIGTYGCGRFDVPLLVARAIVTDSSGGSNVIQQGMKGEGVLCSQCFSPQVACFPYMQFMEPSDLALAGAKFNFQGTYSYVGFGTRITSSGSLNFGIV